MCLSLFISTSILAWQTILSSSFLLLISVHFGNLLLGDQVGDSVKLHGVWNSGAYSLKGKSVALCISWGAHKLCTCKFWDLRHNQKVTNIFSCCLDLLRRLSKSQNTVFCGRIQLFLARLFPLSEKSGEISSFMMSKTT